MNDLRLACRQLLKNRGFAAVAMVILALGIGLNTAVFSLANAILFRSMRVENPNQIVWITARTGANGGWEGSSFLDYTDFRDQSGRAMAGVAAVSGIPTTVYLADPGNPKRVWCGIVTANYFSLLGIRPKYGRLFLDEDDRPGAPPVVALSERLWRGRFGGDLSLIGKSVRVNELSCTVVGVVPERAAVVEHDLGVDVFLPVATFSQLRGGKGQLADRRNRVFDVIGRLSSDVSRSQAQAKFDLVAGHLRQEYPQAWTAMREGRVIERQIRLVRERQARIPPLFASAGVPGYLAGLAAIAAVVLLVACVNLASLLLARAVARRKEFAMRLALGAGRGRLVRQLVIESLVIAALGTLAGLLLAIWATRLLVAWNPVNRFSPFLPPVRLDLVLDARVMIFVIALSTLAVLLFGLTPAWRAARTDLVSSLKAGAACARGGRHIFGSREALIVAQVATSLMLVTGAALLLRGVWRAQAIDLGFDRHRLALLTVALDETNRVPARTWALLADIRSRLQNLPAVHTATVALWVPLGLGEMHLETKLDGYTAPPNEHVAPRMNLVGLRFFDTLRIPMISGRTFAPGDAGLGEAVINEAMAKRYWPGQNPVGRRLQNLFGTFEIVGIAKTIKYASFTETPQPMLFLPVAAWFKKAAPPFMTFLLRTTRPPAGMLGMLRREIQAVAPDIPVLDVKTMQEHLALRAFPTRLAALVAGLFGALALLLAAIGLYGVMSYWVSQRTREMGIRVALGARRGDVLRLVTAHGMRLAVIGATLGLLGAFIGARILRSLLFGLDSTDPITYVAVTLLVALVTLAACWFPARRAANVDPMEALRYE